MDLVFNSWQDIPFNEHHVKQLHQVLLTHSEKDARHRGQYKTHTNSVAAFDENGMQIGIVFETATTFDTPRLMAELVSWDQAADQIAQAVRRAASGAISKTEAWGEGQFIFPRHLPAF